MRQYHNMTGFRQAYQNIVQMFHLTCTKSLNKIFNKNTNLAMPLETHFLQ